jgi:hypothetical protein
MKKQTRLFLILLLILLITSCSGTNQTFLPSSKAEQALEIAIDQTGKPYEWGGRGPNKFDCSGLITWSYKQAVGQEEIFRIGEEIRDDATMSDLYDYNVKLLPLSEIRPGDIVFITDEEREVTHGGLFIEWVTEEEEFKFINASSYHEEVAVDTWPVEGTKRDQWVIGAGRFKVSY